MTDNQMTDNKSAGTAYLLWFFLGSFGAHRFYCGKTGSGIGMLSLFLGSTILTPFVVGLLGFPVLFAWWVVDAFLISKWIDQPQPAVAGSITPDFAAQAHSHGEASTPSAEAHDETSQAA